MSVKQIVVARLDKARSFAESVRAVYDDAYKKAVEARKDGFGGLVQEIEPKLRSVLGEGLQGAQAALDNLNQSLADRAIPAFRKRAVSKEKLDHKTKEVIKEVASKVEPVKMKRGVKKTASVKKERTPTSSRKTSRAKK